MPTGYLLRLLIVYHCGIYPLTQASTRKNNSSHHHVLSEQFSHAAVSSDSYHCSSLGKDVLQQGGSAVDAAIMTVLCLGIISFQSTGIGGGGHMIIYTRSTGKAEVIDFRECAPSGVNDSDFIKPWKEGEYFVDPKLIRGGMSLGVPGMLKGFELAHKRHGTYSWKKLFESAAEIADQETGVSPFFLKKLYEDLRRHNKTEFKEFRTFLASSKENVFRHPALAKTLRIIAKAGNASPFYDGVLSPKIVEDIQKNSGIITLNDLKDYRAIVREPTKIKLDDKKMYSTPPPAGGTILSLILNVLNGYNFSKPESGGTSDKLSKIYHKMIESFKWSYANTGLLEDPDFSPKINAGKDSSSVRSKNASKRFLNQNIKELLGKEYSALIRKAISERRTHNISYYKPDGLVGKLQGTTHVSILAENGDAVSITTSLNDFFGSYVYSKQLGIIFNNQMKDFREFGFISHSGASKPTTNLILPGKRIPSLMTPVIMVDKHKNVIVVIGAAGGSRMPSVMAQVIARYLWLGTSLESAIDKPRFHHQLYPNLVFVERDISNHTRTKLEALGHKISENIELVAHYPLSNLARLNALAVERNTLSTAGKKTIYAVNDKRGGGGLAGY